ncbi:hypothetical protein GQ44DRAFT_752139 [Phaeosphaeriaceae sp. PMI808]|nr:hypothetical protein GQ44DRAFT_752139 [Phaeosphaeriaceae sp. PMI808]
MSSSQAPITQNPNITQPSSFANHPLTPPPTDEKQLAQVHRRHSWTEFQLAEGDYDEIERQLERDEVLSGYVKDKIRYDYSRESDRLVVCMPTAVHKLFIARVEDAVFSQLKSIREGSGDAAAFAQKVYPARSTEIYFPVDDAPSATKSKREPDTSLWHDDAKYPGIIIGVAYSHKRKRLGRLAGDYLLDSNASVQAVVGLDIEYGKKRSRKATLSVWRTHVEGNELRAVQEVADEVFRNEQGHPTEHPGLRLQLSDFADKEPALRESRGKDREIVITTQQLCEYLDAAETKVARLKSLSEDSIAPGLKKRKRAETPPDQITSGDEAKYVGQEERAAKRMAEDETDTKTRRDLGQDQFKILF